MSVVLVSHTGETRSMLDAEWAALLRVARTHGWTPPGSRPLDGVARGGTDPDRYYAVPWTGGLRLGPGDAADAETAAGIADAFERALPSVPAVNTWDLYDWSPQFPANIPPLEWWSGKASDPDVTELLAFLRLGAFRIEAGQLEQEFPRGGLGWATPPATDETDRRPSGHAAGGGPAACPTCGCVAAVPDGGPARPERTTGWNEDEARSLPDAGPERPYVLATVVETGQEATLTDDLAVRERDGRREVVGVADVAAHVERVEHLNSRESWAGRLADGRWFFCEDQGDAHPCCRVYPSLASLALDLWSEWRDEATVPGVLAHLGLLRLDLRAAERADDLPVK